jgi:hypothetical protein
MGLLDQPLVPYFALIMREFNFEKQMMDDGLLNIPRITRISKMLDPIRNIQEYGFAPNQSNQEFIDYYVGLNQMSSNDLYRLSVCRSPTVKKNHMESQTHMQQFLLQTEFEREEWAYGHLFD